MIGPTWGYGGYGDRGGWEEIRRRERWMDDIAIITMMADDEGWRRDERME